MREADLEAFFRKRVRLIGGMTVKLAPTTAGVPDRLVILPGGRIFLVELKTDTGQLSPIQSAWHSRVRAVGGRVYTVYGVTGVVDWLRRMTCAADVDKRRRRSRSAA